MTHDLAGFRRALLERACARYRPVGRFAYHFARGKLGGDAVFTALLARGLIPDAARVLDLGCGQGLLAAWLLAARELHDDGVWPEGWPAPPRLASIRGVDLLPSDIARARAALGPPASFELGDMRDVDFGQADAVVILDVLHYVDFAAQDDVLARVRAALPPGGLFLTRVGDANAGWRFRLSNWVDRAVALGRGNRLPPTHCRSLGEWLRVFQRHGFSVEPEAMNGELPFANTMLVARLNAHSSGPSPRGRGAFPASFAQGCG
jgi:SAM-dependent methyltransferase